MYQKCNSVKPEDEQNYRVTEHLNARMGELLLSGAQQAPLMTLRLVLLVAALANTQPAFPQLSDSRAPLHFEVASVKAQKVNSNNQPGLESMLSAMPVMRGGPGTNAPERVHYSNVTMMSLLTKAYGLHTDQVQGPRWLTEDRFVVDAVVPPGATEEQFRQMLQNLLVERFKLTLRWEERELKVYRLLVAEGGPKLKASAVTQDWNDADDVTSVRAVAAKTTVDSKGCPVLDPTRRAGIGKGTCMTYIGWSMAELAERALSLSIGLETGTTTWAHVIDETGLKGRYDFTLDYDLASQLMRSSPLATEMLAGSPNLVMKTSGIFKAVQAQLGLRVEPSTAKLPVMVIEQIERTPTGN
jgi:uncharacterized protein (TIGR03435 family)